MFVFLKFLVLSLLLVSCGGRNFLFNLKKDKSQNNQIGRVKDTDGKDLVSVEKEKQVATDELNQSANQSELENMYDKMLDGQKMKGKNIYKIAFLAPLSGPNKTIGQSTLDGIKMAMLDSGSNNINLFPFDTAALDMKVIAEKIKSENVDVVLGPIFSQDVEDLVNSFIKISAPIITFSNNAALTKYNSIEIFGVSPIDKIKVAIDYARQNGRQNFAALIKSDAGSIGIQKAITSEVKSTKSALLSIGFYDDSQTRISSSINTILKSRSVTFNIAKDGTPYLMNIKDLQKMEKSGQKPQNQEIRNLDVIITDAGGQFLDTLLSEMDSAGMLKKDIMIISISDSVEVGVLNHDVKFITYDKERFNVFEKFYKETYSTKPTTFSALGYDATGVLLTLFANNNFSYDALHDKAGFIGVSGEFRFGKNHIVERKYCIYGISNNAISKIR
ncbi:penicillin-binding protein activator [Candidatus Deianiraea vastatrix]|uniref:LpoA-like penicillin-binding protein activator n=1 Tax=Candidatus Deianiraea vastatrix TaxID=2163644 RepID=A0A5B8XET6_9RICK|nr:penicillin-binding protein activator [Candidatus Deianiraea vastatrix]QED22924.1 Putative LpoA-like penicillin-binding protein activator [Candidatus Deianiraea vastatrix]